MTVYADSSFYERTYLSGRTAVIPSSEFGFYARRASNVIRQYTLGNIGDDVPACVKSCCCELAELIYSAEHGKAAQGIASEKVGDVSISYENADSLRQALPKQMKSAVYAWLADTGLLRRGGDLC